MEQPAQKSYFFGPCSEDRNQVITGAWNECHALGAALTDKFAYKGTNQFWSAVVGFWGWSARIVYTGVATALMTTMILLHGAVLAVCQGSAVTTVALLRLGDAAWTRLWRIHHPCPEKYCRDSRPHHRCPACGVMHTDLRPGPYGVFRRVCQCGVSLPTLHHLGRESLECVCSVCGSQLANVQSSDVHVVFAGGAFCGKTNLLYMSLKEMWASYRQAGLTDFEFAEPPQKHAVEKQVHALQHGTPADKTVQVAPRALQLLLGRKLSPVPTRIYFYDVAGESFESGQAVAEHAFYDRLDAIIFVVDPLSIPSIGERYKDAITSQKLPGCTTLPEDAYARMLSALKSYSIRGTDGFRQARLAVVVSKADLFDIQAEIDTVARTMAEREAEKPKAFVKIELVAEIDPASHACRQWLIDQGQANLVRLIDNDFEDHQYFAVSALGRNPSLSDHTSFEGVGVLAPVIWSIGHRLRWRS